MHISKIDLNFNYNKKVIEKQLNELNSLNSPVNAGKFKCRNEKEKWISIKQQFDINVEIRSVQQFIHLQNAFFSLS